VNRVFVGFLALSFLASNRLAAAPRIPFYLDAGFEAGFEVLAPDLPVTIEGNLQWDASGGPPQWQIAQWGSQSSLFGVSPTTTPSGASVYSNADKSLTAGGGTAALESDLILSANAFNEYGGQYRSAGQPWPHLLVEQKISTGFLWQVAPSIAQMANLNFNVDAKLLFDNRNIGPGYNSALHASQFVHFLTIQNLNQSSSGFGDFYWFGTQIYDDRVAVTSLEVKGDPGTGKMIYNTGIAPYTSEVVADGNWVNVSGDLLPRIKAGLQEAWNRGFLLDSQDMSDYYIGASNLGWEIPGLNYASMQIRNLSLEAHAFGSSNFVLSPGDDDWTNAANWDQGLPDLATDVGIADSARIGVATSAEANILRVGWASLAAFNETGLLTVEGDLTVYHSIRLGSDGTGVNGTMVVEAGATVDNLSMAAVGEFWVGATGTAELFVLGTINSASMDITNWQDPGTTTGTVNVLPGGVVNLAGRLTVGGWGGNASLLISPGGSLSTGDNWSGMLDSWELSGAIRATLGATLVVTPHTTDAGRTYTAALVSGGTVPEPTSAMLLLVGLAAGCVCFRQQRKNGL